MEQRLITISAINIFTGLVHLRSLAMQLIKMKTGHTGAPYLKLNAKFESEEGYRSN